MAVVLGLALVPLGAGSQQARGGTSVSTGKVINDAITALNDERYRRAKAELEKLDLDTLSPYERSIVEQILFSIEYAQQNLAAAREHLQRAIDAGGLNDKQVQDARRQIAVLDDGGSSDAVEPVPSAETRPARRLRFEMADTPVNEGLVAIRFVVGVNGKVTRVVVEDAVGPGVRKLERALRDSLERWTFEPATLRGRPVPQAGGGLHAYSYVSGEDAVSAGFAKRYEQASKLVAAGKVAEAGEAVDDLLDGLVSSREFINFSLLEAQFAAAADDPRRQYRAIARVVLLGSRTELTPAQKYQALQVKFGLEARMNRLADALDTYAAIKEHSLYPIERNEDIEALAAQFEATRQADSPIVVDAALDPLESADGPVWKYRLLGRRVAITDVSGELRSLEFLCTKNHVVEAFAGQKTWELSEDWGECSLYVFGAAGTTFRLTDRASD